MSGAGGFAVHVLAHGVGLSDELGAEFFERFRGNAEIEMGRRAERGSSPARLKSRPPRGWDLRVLRSSARRRVRSSRAVMCGLTVARGMGREGLIGRE